MAAKKKTTTKRKSAPKRPKAASKRKATQPNARKATAPKPGTTIERAYKGKTYHLRVTDDGFELGKKVFKSLTASAKHVTGYASISGVRFWLGQPDEKACA